MEQLNEKTKDNISKNNCIEDENSKEKENDLNKNDCKQEKTPIASKVSKYNKK